MDTSIAGQEELIRKYLEEDNRDAAVKLLFEMIVACAKQKNFKDADAHRERIFEIDPMALTEIIRSGEIIEQEKTSVINIAHRKIWAAFYDRLTAEEANAFYFALRNECYGPHETIYSQGEHKQRLFLVNSGRLKLFYITPNGLEVLLKTLSQGQIAGEDTFFSSTICTTSMVSLARTELSCLDAEVLKRWRTDFPVLESKIREFASNSEPVDKLIREMKLDRRGIKRVSICGSADAHLMSAAGTPVGRPFKVEVSDISLGGIAFFVRITKRDTATVLLGQRVNIRYAHPRGDHLNLDRNGTIVAVRFHPLEECSVSVRFEKRINRQLIDEFERLAPAPGFGR